MVNFLGLKRQKINKKPLAVLSRPARKMPHMTSNRSVLFPFDNKKRIRLYGDNDYDGTPNKWDCVPNHPGKDGFFSNLMNKVTGGRVGQSDEAYKAERETRAKVKAAYAISNPKKRKSAIQRIKEIAGRREGSGKYKTMAKVYNPATGRTERKLVNRKYYGVNMPDTYRTGNVAASELRKQSLLEKLNKVKDVLYKKEQRKVEVPVYEGKGKNRRRVGTRVIIKTGATGILSAAPKIYSAMTISPERLKRMNVNEVSTRRGSRFKTAVGGVLEAGGYRSELLPKRTGRKGRPEKTYKYNIPGVGPVGVYEFRKWLSGQKKALSRQQKIQILQLKQQARMQQAQQEASTPQQQQAMYAQATGSEMQPDQIAALQQAQAEQYSYQQQLPQRGTPVNIYEKQLRDLEMQQTMEQYPTGQQMPSQPVQGQTGGSILDAPNIFNSASESQATNILRAPNVARGELRKQNNQNNQTRSVNVGNSPMSNVQGNDYYDIDVMTGKPLPKRRITEKWATSEAL